MNTTKLRRYQALGVLLLPLILAACSVLPKPDPVTLYHLPSQPLALQVDTGRPLAITLQVNRPQANGLLAGERITVSPKPNQLSVYQGAQWATSVPVLFRDQLITRWQQYDHFEHIISDHEALPADLELQGALRAFYTEYQQDKPRVVIYFDAQLIEHQSRTLLASKQFVVHQAPDAVEVSAVVAAFGVAHAQLADELLSWLLGVIENKGRDE